MPDRPPILFLHGAFGGADVWRRFVAPWFAKRGHRVAAPPLPGDGAAAPARMRDFVNAARAAADALGGAPVVVGHSFGGLVAQHLAAERRLAGLALVASPGPGGLAPSLWRLTAFKPKVLTALMLAQAGLGPLLGVNAARAALFTEEAEDSWIRRVAAPPTAESPAALYDGMTWDLPLWPLARGTPTLALLGDRDAFIPMTDLLAIRVAYGAEVEVFHGMAHGLPIDPRWKRLAWRIEAWLSERAIGGRREAALPG
ncbi:MAG: alpha/beta hydrolase [Rhodobacteraceae bacterium]|nr:MAG: alpha/beta hydrolase [Paracoccaceae bacterium]